MELGSLSNLTTLEIARSGLSGCVPGNLEDQLASWSDLRGLPFCCSHAPSAGDGRHIARKALPARVGYGASKTGR